MYVSAVNRVSKTDHSHDVIVKLSYIQAAETREASKKRNFVANYHASIFPKYDALGSLTHAKHHTSHYVILNQFSNGGNKRRFPGSFVSRVSLELLNGLCQYFKKLI